MSSTVLDIDTTVRDKTGEPELCESKWCENRGRGVHEADYTAHLNCPCRLAYLVCQERVDHYDYQVSILCSRCEGTCPVLEILVWPLRGGGL